VRAYRRFSIRLLIPREPVCNYLDLLVPSRHDTKELPEFRCVTVGAPSVFNPPMAQIITSCSSAACSALGFMEHMTSTSLAPASATLSSSASRMSATAISQNVALFVGAAAGVSSLNAASVYGYGDQMNRIQTILILLCCLTISAAAQADRATLSGTVNDPSGAAMAGVHVRADRHRTDDVMPFSVFNDGLYDRDVPDRQRLRRIIPMRGALNMT
jgi:hypothetical protein